MSLCKLKRQLLSPLQLLVIELLLLKRALVFEALRLNLALKSELIRLKLEPFGRFSSRKTVFHQCIEDLPEDSDERNVCCRRCVLYQCVDYWFEVWHKGSSAG